MKREAFRNQPARRIASIAIAAFIAVAGAAHAQTPPSTAQSQSQIKEAGMKTFVFIFRQSPVPLTKEQKDHRAQEVRNWAIQLRDQGHTMNPHILGEEHYLAAPAAGDSSAPPAKDDPVAAILIVDFPSFEEAKKAADSHPGRNYGVSVEVREAFAPPPAPPAQ